ncbi:hypothetical protein PR202_ga14555 [Eleusine coracana subsp. coracana]|uniref:Uncharacterized protein n=1 Tax=Eleusine coracana subsp. coracana TaxID=191504 RepID=A0AAV5CHR8_ELECO|nr:hypothetical protein PR202_ga14555 [Eleusine coracana subsp. coracana]
MVDSELPIASYGWGKEHPRGYEGILLKGGHVLDALASCQSVAFDKTGTLSGKLTCNAIEPIHGHLGVESGLGDSSCCTPNCESEALAVAAAMEKGATNPKVRNDESELAKASIGSVEYISSLYRSSGGGLIMVGDGINDVPALAATLGIVLAQCASVTAVAIADALLLQDNICGVPFCIATARQTTSLVLLHEGGTLLVCLNSIQALNAPTWSLADDVCQLLDGPRNYISEKLNGSSPNRVANAVPL